MQNLVNSVNPAGWDTGFDRPYFDGGGLSQEQLRDLWAKAGESGGFFSRGSQTWDAEGRQAHDARYLADGDDNRENDFYVVENDDGTLGKVDIMRHGWNGQFASLVAMMAPAIAGVAGAGAGASAGGAGASTAGTDAFSQWLATGATDASTIGGMGGGAGSVGAGSVAASMAPGYSVGMVDASSIANPLAGSAEQVVAGLPSYNAGGMAAAAGGGGAAAAGGGGGGGAASGGAASAADPLTGYLTTGATDASTYGGMSGFASSGGAGAVGSGSTAGTLQGIAGLFGGAGSTGGWANTAGTLLNGYLGQRAADKAANAQIGATKDANALMKYMYDQTRADNMPALEARNAGLTGYQNLLKNPSSVARDPGYQFGFDQGTKAIGTQAAARGNYYSGKTLKDLTRFGQDYGQSKFDQSLNRHGNLAGLGQVGSGQIGQAGMQYGQQAGQNLIGAGNARGAAAIAGANSWQNALNGLMSYGNQNNWWGRP